MHVLDPLLQIWSHAYIRTYVYIRTTYLQNIQSIMFADACTTNLNLSEINMQMRSLWTAVWFSVCYRMGINFRGVLIFVVFVGLLHPRKIYLALIFATMHAELYTTKI